MELWPAFRKESSVLHHIHAARSHRKTMSTEYAEDAYAVEMYIYFWLAEASWASFHGQKNYRRHEGIPTNRLWCTKTMNSS